MALKTALLKYSDTPHYEKVPFEVPNGWVWCRLEDIVCELKYGTSEKSSSMGKIAVLRMGNITNVGTIDYSNLVYSSNDEDIKQYSLEKDDLLFNRTNSSEWVGKTAIYKEEQPAIYAGYLIRIRPLLISPDYLNTVMNSGYYRDWCYNVKTDAVNQSNINAQKLSQLMIPIPPLKEQGRIVAEMDKWISLIDIVKNGKDDLLTIIKQAKSKILDFAIHGKLVPQDLNDEPASELLKRINPNAEITCDNGHSEKLPDAWCHCRINDVSLSLLGKTLDRSKNTGNLKKYLCAVNVKWGIFDLATIKEMRIDDTELERYSVKNGDLMVCEGGDVGRAAIWTYNSEIYYQNALHRIRFKNNISARYFLYSLMYLKSIGIIDDVCKGVTIKHLTQNAMDSLIFNLPPLAEQQRIVQKIEELFSVLDNIQKALEV